jgi:hypothetical protein
MRDYVDQWNRKATAHTPWDEVTLLYYSEARFLNKEAADV